MARRAGHNFKKKHNRPILGVTKKAGRTKFRRRASSMTKTLKKVSGAS